MKQTVSHPYAKICRDIFLDENGNVKSDAPKNGLLTYFLSLAFAAAYTDGTATYCHYKNDVKQGEWVGGIVGLKSILSSITRERLNQNDVLEILSALSASGLIEASYNETTKVFKVKVLHVKFGNGVRRKSVKYETPYASTGYGFVFIEKEILENLVKTGERITKGDATVDLILHTITGDKYDYFSLLCPVVKYCKDAALSMNNLAERWGWSKSKVSRFFRKNDLFTTVKLPGSLGTLAFSNLDARFSSADAVRKVGNLVNAFLRKAKEIVKRTFGDERARFNYAVFLYSRVFLRYSGTVPGIASFNPEIKKNFKEGVFDNTETSLHIRKRYPFRYYFSRRFTPEDSIFRFVPKRQLSAVAPRFVRVKEGVYSLLGFADNPYDEAIEFGRANGFVEKIIFFGGVWQRDNLDFLDNFVDGPDDGTEMDLSLIF